MIELSDGHRYSILYPGNATSLTRHNLQPLFPAYYHILHPLGIHISGIPSSSPRHLIYPAYNNIYSAYLISRHIHRHWHIHYPACMHGPIPSSIHLSRRPVLFLSRFLKFFLKNGSRGGLCFPRSIWTSGFPVERVSRVAKMGF